MDLRTWGVGWVSWDEVRKWHGHIYTTKHKLDSGELPAQGDQLGALLSPRRVGYGGWEGDIRWRRYGCICICIADSLCYKAETNTPL